MTKISDKKLRMIEETLKDFKCLLPRYLEVRNDETLLRSFCTRNRNPIWDITNIKYFKTGLKSKKASQHDDKECDDHFIQRRFGTKFIFEQLSKHPEMTLHDFILLLKKISSTVKITREEHKIVTSLSKGCDIMNYVLYEFSGIDVPGLSEVTKNLKINNKYEKNDC